MATDAAAVRGTVPAALAGERVDRVVALLTGLPRSEVAELVAGGAVRLGGRAVPVRSTRVAEGDEVEVDVPPPAERSTGPEPEPGVDVPLVMADADVLVVDKPPGLVVHPGAGNRTGTLVSGLLARFPELEGVGQPERPGIVHRLDRDTSGLMVVARTQAAYESLVGQLAARSVSRRYLALVWGHPEPASGLVDAPIGRSAKDPTRMAVTATGREARTSFAVTSTFTTPGPVAVVEAGLETGRTHQVRVHLAAIGHPVVGDHRYGGARPSVPAPRPFLHAAELAFDHPATGTRVELSSPLPADLRAVLARLD